MLNIRRTYTRITRDILPGLGNKVLRRRPQPRGRERTIAEEWSMAVPFRYAPAVPHQRIAIVCHMYHVDIAEHLLSVLLSTGMAADLLISTDTEAKAEKLAMAARAWKSGTVTIRITENRGRDIAPKLIAFSDLYSGYDLVLFLHSKNSETLPGGGWREYLLACLAGSPSVVGGIIEIFRCHPEVGMVVPPHYPRLREWEGGVTWAANFRRARRLAWKMDIDIGENGIIDFPSGSMFWARPAALKPLLDLGLRFSDFPAEPLPLDGTLPHWIERLFLFSCEKAGFKWVKVLNETVATPEQPRVQILRPEDIAAFMGRYGLDLLKNQPN